MKYKITAPNRAYTGESGGVAFSKGIGYADESNRLDWFREKGYGVELLPEQPFAVAGANLGQVGEDFITITDKVAIDQTLADSADSVESTIKAIKAMKVSQLSDVAEELGVDISNCKNAEEKKETIINYILDKEETPKESADEEAKEGSLTGADEA